MSAPAERLTAALSDRYRLDRELGQGGTAIVYLAHDVKHDRQVALKVFKPCLERRGALREERGGEARQSRTTPDSSSEAPR